MFKFFVSKITFSGGQEIGLVPNSINILIGPNSCGKSTALGDMSNLTDADQHNRLVIKATNVAYEDEEHFDEWMRSSFLSVTRPGNEYVVTTDATINANDPIVFRPPPNYQRNIHYLRHLLTTSQRLEIGNPKNAIDLRRENPSHYIHVMQSKDELQTGISSLVEDAFGENLLIDMFGGTQVYFRVGQKPNFVDRLSTTYRDAISRFPMLNEMGDGIRSYVGALLAIKCGNFPVLFIDEPEAFLHPQQIRKMGALLAKSAGEANRQIIVATHSSAIIRGALSAGGNISIIRIEREGEVNNGYLLDSKDIHDLWAKPLLKSSGAIAGIFHEGVIVCEGDADCRFYEAIQNQMEEQGRFAKPLDNYYVHGGTKGEAATLAKSYKALNVNTACIVDFDILRNQREFKILCEVMEIDFANIERQFNSAKAALDDVPPISSVEEVLQSIDEVLAQVRTHGEMGTAHKKAISSLLRNAAKWSAAKKYGIDKLTGGARRACKAMMELCASHGLFLVPKGELESWWRDGPGNKNEWIIQALEGIGGGLELPEARDFLIKVFQHTGIPLRN